MQPQFSKKVHKKDKQILSTWVHIVQKPLYFQGFDRFMQNVQAQDDPCVGDIKNESCTAKNGLPRGCGGVRLETKCYGCYLSWATTTRTCPPAVGWASYQAVRSYPSLTWDREARV